jgi:hypothetical protein
MPSNSTCASEHLHTPHPADFLAHLYWADVMAKTHTQHRCPGCRLWVIWTPKEAT